MLHYRRYAASIAGAYLVVGAFYIVTSGRVATQLSSSLPALARIEEVKGIVFVVMTAAGLYLFSLRLLKAITRDAADLLRNRDVLIASERRSLAGVLAGALAQRCSVAVHSLNGALERFRGEAALRPEDQVRLDAVKAPLENLSAEIARLRQSGVSFAAGDRRKMDLGALVRSSVEISRSYPALHRCQVSMAETPAILCSVYPALIHQAVASLLFNAAEATHGTGRIVVALRREERGIVLEVSDNGPGVPVELRESIFEPFFTSRPASSGLGLLTVRVCADLHGGHTEITTSTMRGACFELVFPRDIEVSNGASPAAQPPLV